MLLTIAGFVACDSNEPSIEPKLQLSADKSEIIANGEDTAIFTVKNSKGEVLEDATIHFADSHEALEGKTFKTKYAGEYSFYAQHGSAKSDTLKVTAKEDNGTPGPDPQDKALKLTVEPATIYVNETATFKVELDGNDVTADATIYLKEGDVLVFEEEGRGYIKPVEEFVTVSEAIDELSCIKDMG